jgi:signal transduction histidine kinase
VTAVRDAATAAAGDPIQVLMVDDHPENLIALEALLRGDGITLLKARTGAEALELLLASDVSLALLDVQMPEMDGFELAELMRGTARTRHVPIIFVTAGARDAGRMFKGYETGAVDFLYKPIDPLILRGKVGVFLELARQRQALAQVLRLNEMFVGVISHDLRNPLGAIIASADLLRPQLTDERQQMMVRWITDAGRRMTSLIDQLIDLTRGRLNEGVGFVREHAEVDVRGLVLRTIDELRGTAADREIMLDGAAGYTVAGDTERLLQLFSNLLGNALAHGTPQTPIAVTISGNARDITIEMHNHGAIPPDLLATLFEPFRGSHQRTERSSGLGLGLYIAREIAKAHGGDIGVASSEAEGTAFRIRLPRRADQRGGDAES